MKAYKYAQFCESVLYFYREHLLTNIQIAIIFNTCNKCKEIFASILFNNNMIRVLNDKC